MDEERVTEMDVPEAAKCPVGHGAAAAAPQPAESERTTRRAAMPASALPGPTTHVVKQILRYWKRPDRFVEECREQYGSRFALRIRIPPRPLYVLSDPEDIKQMFMAPADVLHTGNGSATIEKFTGQTGLAWLDEDEHKERRRILMPSMHGKALQRIEESIDRRAVEEIAEWPRDRVVELHPLIHRFTLNVIREVIFGGSGPSNWDELLDVLIAMMKFNNRMGSAALIHKMSPRTVRMLARIKPIGLGEFLELRKRADKLIADAVAEHKRNAELGDDMLSVLLRITHEDGSPLTQVELRDEMMTIFLAGTETTASAIAWGFEYLSLHTEARERLVAELDAGVSDEYLTATVNEVLRLRPSIPQIIPRTVMKPIEIGGVRFEPGMLLWASAYLLHRDPELYPDPYAFKPDRFLGAKPGTYTWIPFGGGRIRCLGASIALIEMKAVFREVLKHCELRRPEPGPEGTRSRSVSTLPAKGARMELRARTADVSMA
ncbi:cytochrome P450 [Micromonospora sp. ATCC 39149]|uniref:Cytochrome P450 n=1 Tax=Micromonospora carbonacea TaxID=47853 RepID=A0A7D6CD57_9ACTN|nr:cytochrome P450 [Micromonospora sp. ATCC 39149]QLJ96949.1 cytochrome P450 [Micromonospora carbonacea]